MVLAGAASPHFVRGYSCSSLLAIGAIFGLKVNVIVGFDLQFFSTINKISIKPAYFRGFENQGGFMDLKGRVAYLIKK